MLVLGRKINDDTIIEDICTIRILAIEFGKVKLGISTGSDATLAIEKGGQLIEDLPHSNWLVNLIIDEELIINSDIKVKLLKIKGKLVSLGFEAPKHININRKERINRG